MDVETVVVLEATEVFSWSLTGKSIEGLERSASVKQISVARGNSAPTNHEVILNAADLRERVAISAGFPTPVIYIHFLADIGLRTGVTSDVT